MTRCEHGFLGPIRVEPPAAPAQSAPHQRGTHAHPAFVDMTGQTIAGVVVESRLRNAPNGARWRVRCACGEQFDAMGTRLRQIAREGGHARCERCRPRRPGTVTRVAAAPLQAGSR